MPEELVFPWLVGRTRFAFAHAVLVVMVGSGLGAELVRYGLCCASEQGLAPAFRSRSWVIADGGSGQVVSGRRPAFSRWAVFGRIYIISSTTQETTLRGLS